MHYLVRGGTSTRPRQEGPRSLPRRDFRGRPGTCAGERVPGEHPASAARKFWGEAVPPV